MTSDDRPGSLDYRVLNLFEDERFDVYVDDELVAEGGFKVEIRSNLNSTEDDE